MGIASILTAAVRYVSWGQVANVALQYGPEIMKKLKERRQPIAEPEDVAGAIIDQLQGRIEELEETLVKQQELIELQTRTINMLEEATGALRTKLSIFIAIAAGSILLSLVLLALVLRN